jgi:hypothetical protein
MLACLGTLCPPLTASRRGRKVLQVVRVQIGDVAAMVT